jgi:hypothetical protein
MNGAPDLSASSSAGLASWYVPGRADGFGDRLQMFDNSGAPSLELLRFHADLAATPGFEDSLRDRVRELKSFRHPSFGTVRAVQHLDNGDGLALVSVHEPGQRLSEIFAQRPRKALHPGIVTWFLKELTPALVALHEQGPGVAHGALTADRIVLSPDGRLCIVEHVLGSALQQLGRAPARLWREFGLVALPPGGGAANLDARTDVLQLGGVALSLLLARPVTLGDVEERLPALLEEMSGAVPPGSAHQLLPLRQWLERALQLTAPVYRTAADALVDLKELPSHGASRSVSTAHVPAPALTEAARDAVVRQATTDRAYGGAAVLEPAVAFTGPQAFDQGSFVSAGDEFVSEHRDKRKPADSGDSKPDVARTGPADAAPAAPRAARPARPEKTVTRPSVARPFVPPPPAASQDPRSALADAAALWADSARPATPPTPDRAAPVRSPAPNRNRAPREGIRGLGPKAAAVLCAIVLVEAAVIALLVFRSPGVTAGSSTVTIESNPGDTVLVNGEPAGITPLQLRVGSDTRSLRIVSGAPVATTGNVAASAAAPTPRPARREGAPVPRSGSIRLVSDIDLTVHRNGETLGSSSSGPIVLQPGEHQIEVVNEALGFRAVQSVTVAPGEERSVRVTLPTGTVNLNAQPWAEVTIDGNPVGQTPLANVQVPIGTHDVIFRHPELGERRQTVVVRTGEPIRVTASFDP